MKVLLTSGGVLNDSIRNALVYLLGKPIEKANALIIPTAGHALPQGPARAWDGVGHWQGLGWGSLGLLELTALPSVEENRWRPSVETADALLVNGGDPLYLCYWMRRSGLAGLLPSLERPVYVGLSAGSMIMAPRIGEEFVGWRPPDGDSDETLGIVPFSIFPHLDHPMLPDNIMPTAEKWAAKLPNPAYAMDDDTAIQVVDGDVSVISEGKWVLLEK